ncbi:flagellar biosynthesis anti-sigma factor FlgM [Paraburkholderia diazotrophica]|uniref:Negative regulator of flagellin synthesis n=1 Tax=Paraburkholderia diazotrophica TaxID=667676 RepID=A0A1H7EJ41_9BURK|nr:flagellar biosynthesis anti-sigma factor FlgM [Paraburkholderia diazotrophica]SEK13614.1 anti-sigma-28 factor, FlgM family [Paraburkholderia diazotrophica]
MKVDSTTQSGLQTLKDGLQRTQQGDTAATGGASTATSSASTATGASGDANVNLSGLSSHLQSLASAGASDIDTAHVESIKQAIKDGTLTIDSGKIADGVLATARELLQQTSQSAGN